MCVQPMKSIAAVALSATLSGEDDGYEWNVGTMAASGIITGAMVLFLGLTGLIEVVNRIIPRDVVSGLQIGVGLRLAGKGIRMVAELGWIDSYDCILLGIICSLFCMFWLRDEESNKFQNNSLLEIEDIGNTTAAKMATVEVCTWESESGDSKPPSSSTCNVQLLLKRLCLCLLQPFLPQSSTSRRTPHPVGIYLFLLGMLFATISLSTAQNNNNKSTEAQEDDTNVNQYDLPLRFFGAPVAIWTIKEITKKDWKVGLLEGAIPQLPLTTLNSVISVCALAHSLYPPKQQHEQRQNGEDQTSLTKSSTNLDNIDNDNVSVTKVPSRKEVAISVGLINLLFCPFGSMPNCHGAGGLAGQYRLGARNGTSVVFLGLGKVLLALFFGRSALALLDAFPSAVLGVMLTIAGQELATTGFMLLINDVFDECNKDEVVSQRNRDGNGNKTYEDNEITMITAKVNDERQHQIRNPAQNTKSLVRQSIVIATITTMVIVTLGKTHYGALSGWVAHMLYGRGATDFKAWCYRRRQNRRQSIQGRN